MPTTNNEPPTLERAGKRQSHTLNHPKQHRTLHLCFISSSLLHLFSSSSSTEQKSETSYPKRHTHGPQAPGNRPIRTKKTIPPTSHELRHDTHPHTPRPHHEIRFSSFFLLWGSKFPTQLPPPISTFRISRSRREGQRTVVVSGTINLVSFDFILICPDFFFFHPLITPDATSPPTSTQTGIFP